MFLRSWRPGNASKSILELIRFNSTEYEPVGRHGDPKRIHFHHFPALCPRARAHAPKAHGPWAHGPRARGPWAHGPRAQGPWAFGPWDHKIDTNGYVSGRHASPWDHIRWNRSVSPPGSFWKRSRASWTLKTDQNRQKSSKTSKNQIFP